MARLIKCAPARQVLSAQFSTRGGHRSGIKHRDVCRHCARSVSLAADTIGVAPLRRPPNIDCVNRHAPSRRSLTLNALWSLCLIAHPHSTPSPSAHETGHGMPSTARSDRRPAHLPTDLHTRDDAHAVFRAHCTPGMPRPPGLAPAGACCAIPRCAGSRGRCASAGGLSWRQAVQARALLLLLAPLPRFFGHFWPGEGGIGGSSSSSTTLDPPDQVNQPRGGGQVTGDAPPRQ